MAIRNIRKNLAGMEDLLQGLGTENQVRGDASYVIGKIDTPYAVSTVAAMQALDIAVFTRARVYDGTIDYIDYIYDPLDLTGIVPTEGAGTWIQIASSSSQYSPGLTKEIEGDLSSATNVFTIPALTQVAGTLSYHAIADQTDIASGTRDETYGKKSFAGYVDASGVWTSFLAFADEVTERSNGTAAAPTLALVNGTSAGAFISFLAAGAGYNVADSRAVVKIEALTFTRSQLTLA